MKKNFKIFTSDNFVLSVDIYGYDKVENTPIIIFLHGFKGFKDWGFIPFVCDFFSKKEFIAISMNFSHNGIGDNLDKFTEFDKFANNTYTRELNEALFLIESLENGKFEKKFTGKKAIIGHSRGGALAILAAFESKKIDALALYASISKLDRFTSRQKKEWKLKGYLEFKNERTGQIFKINSSFLEDLERNKHRLDLESSLKSLDIPILIAHGTEDLTVPISEAVQLYEWSKKDNVEFIKIENTGHAFGCEHPLKLIPIVFENLLEKTYLFFKKNLY
jgi:alpha-beta hydrolase superfamily lysophospholipase